MRLHRLAFAVVVLAAPARAADPGPESSLKMIPADAAFYSTSLRLGEQMDRFLKSNAYAKLRELPAAKFAADHVREAAGKPDSPVGQMMQLLKDPANQELADLLRDLPRQEVFIYGGAGWTDLLSMATDLNSAMIYAPFQAGLTGQNPTIAQRRAILQTLNSSAEKLAIPELVLGFKLSKAAPAIAQLKRLEAVLTKVTANVPALKGRVKRQNVAGAEALTLSLDGSLIPLDDANLDILKRGDGAEGEKADLQKLVAKLKAMTLGVSLLVKDDYLLLTVGPSPKVAEKLGQGLGLAARPELAPVAKFADRNLVAIGYLSKALAAGSSTTGENLTAMLDVAKEALDKVPLTEKRRAAIDKDLKRLVTEATASLPKPGATVAVSFLSARGQESYVYNYGTSPHVAAPKRLTILDHVGGAPLVAAAGGVSDPTPGYRYLVTWINTIFGHLDGAAKELAPEQVYAQFQQGMEMVLPFLKKFNDITGDQFLPALGDGEMALALDAKWTSKQWLKDLDQGGKDLPLPEIGVVRSVADAAKLVKAFQAYRDLINEVMAKANDFGANLPEGGIPKPESKSVPAGTVYFWPLKLPDAPLDKQVQPNVALSDKLFAFSLSVKHSERLLAPTPLKLDEGPLADKKPALTAAVVDFAGFVGALRPWVEQLALPIMLEQVPDNAPPGLSKKEIPAQVKTILDVLGCLRTYTSVTYKEGDATVTHSELVIQDLK
jgi:hypothetical protein